MKKMRLIYSLEIDYKIQNDRTVGATAFVSRWDLIDLDFGLLLKRTRANGAHIHSHMAKQSRDCLPRWGTTSCSSPQTFLACVPHPQYLSSTYKPVV